MNRSALAMTLLILSASQATAQEMPAYKIGPAQQLQYFGNRMVGGTWHQQLPEGSESRHTYRWALGNNFLFVHEWNADKPNSLTVGGVDPETNLQTWWSFQDDGGVRIRSFDVARMSPSVDKVVIVDENTERRGVIKVAWEDEDTLVSTPKSGTRASGEPLSAEQWRRSKDIDDISWVNAEQPATIPDEMWLARHTTGKKWLDGFLPDGSKFLGAGQGKWILNGKFHVYTGSIANDDQTAWSHVVITGIDPNTERVASWEFTSIGAKNSITYDDSGHTIFGAGMLPDGSKQSFEGRFDLDGDILRYRSKIIRNGGEAEPYGWDYRSAE